MFIKLIGIAGGLLFVVSGILTAMKVLQEGRVSFIPRSTMYSVLFGSILSLMYLFLIKINDIILIFNYIITIICWLIILYYEYYPKVKGN